MKNLFVFLIGLVILHLAVSWRGSQITQNSVISISSGSEEEIGLVLTVSVTDPSEKVLLFVNFAVWAATAKTAMRFTIFRNDVTNLGGTYLKAVESFRDDEMMPVVINYFDTPGVGAIKYTVYAYGDGTISYSNSLRQFAAVIIESTYSASTAVATTIVNPPSTSLGLTTSVTTATTTDRVILLLNMDNYNVTEQADIAHEFNRGGGFSLGMKPSYGYGGGVSASMGFMDTPGSASPLNYFSYITRTTFSHTIIGRYNAKRSLTAIVVPNGQIANSLTSSMLSITVTAWTATSLTVTLAPQSTSAKVLLMFNADLIFMSASKTTACITIYRGAINLGDATYGLQTLSNGGVQFARRSPMLMWLDSPGTATSVTYTIYVRSLEGLEFQFGRGNLQTHFTAVIVSDSYYVPTLAPVRSPTAVPTAQPSAPITTCTAGCTVMNSGTFGVAPGNFYGQYYLPRYFKISFQIYGMSVAANNVVRKNMLDLVNVATGASLLAVDITDAAAIRIFYNGVATATYSVSVVPNFGSTYTTLSVSILNSQLVAGSSDNTGYNPSYTISNIDPTGNIYKLYLSNNVDGSSGGTVQNIFITGM